MQGIEFQIVNDSAEASRGLDELAKSLANLKTSLGTSGSAMSRLAKNITNIKTAVSGLNTSKITELGNALNAFGNATASLSISSSIGNQVQKIASAVTAIPDSTSQKLNDLATSLKPLTELGKQQIGPFITQLKKIPELVTELETVDMSKFKQQMEDLANAMKPFADEMQKVANGFSAFPSRIQRLITSTEKYNGTVRTAETNTSRWSSALKTISLAAVTKKASSLLAKAINRASVYTETLNMFTVALGLYSKEAYQYAQKVSEVMGIDPAVWMENQGVFNSILSGFGIADEKASVMSQNLTQLAYDLSSFYDIGVTEAMQKVQSGISGELEPLRRLGYDLSVARLQQEAYTLGITKSVSEMTQAEKAQLRYHAMLTQVTQAQGDMARTLEEPANQLRVLKAQIEQASRAFGNLFIPVLNAVLPVATAVVSALREIINAIAALFGIQMADSVDFGDSFSTAAGASGTLAENVEDAVGEAKKLKSYLVGIDELNVISPNSAGAGGTGFDIEPISYDFLGDAVTEKVDAIKAKLEPFVTWITEHLRGILAITGMIGAAFLVWKLSGPFMTALNGLKTGLNIALQLAGKLFGSSGPLTAGAASVGKFAAIAGTIAVIVLRFIDLYNNSEKFRTGLERLGEIATGVFEGVKTVVGNVWEGLKGIGGAVLNLLPESAREKVQGFFETMQGWLGTLDLDWKDFAITIAGIAALFVPGGQLVGAALLGFEGISVLIRGLGGLTDEQFAAMLDKVKSVFSGMLESAKKTFDELKTRFSLVIAFAKDLFSGALTAIKLELSGLIKFVTGVFTGDWSKAWEGIKEIVRGVFVGIKSIVITALNVIIRALNRIHVDIPDWVPVIGGKSFGVNIQEIELPTMANGGVVNSGQMFIAREAGPELVGSIGSRTAVVNNDQIVASVAGGVAEANESQNALLREQNELLRAILAKDTGVVLDGKTLLKSTEKAARQRGAVIMAGGVMG